ncbi:hypothetical protein HN51_046392 [Arachis hypogaea]
MVSWMTITFLCRSMPHWEWMRMTAQPAREKSSTPESAGDSGSEGDSDNGSESDESDGGDAVEAAAAALAAELERGVGVLLDGFARLDSRISSVGQRAAKIGDHLQLEVLPVILCHHLKQNWTISSFLLFVAVVCSEEWPMSLLLLKRLANLFEGTLRIRKGVQRQYQGK